MAEVSASLSPTLGPQRCPKRAVRGYNSPAMYKRISAYLYLMILAFCLVLPLTLLMMNASAIPEPAKPLLVATNQGDRDLSIIDPAADKQLATVPEGGITGHEVATSPDGRTAYVPIYGDSGVGKPGTDGREMVVIDIASRKVTGKVDFGHGVRPHCPVYDRVHEPALCDHRTRSDGDHRRPAYPQGCGHRPHRAEGISHARDHSRRAARVYLECGRRFRFGAGYGRTQDDRDNSDLGHSPAHCHLQRRQDGLHLRPDEAATGGHRHRHQQRSRRGCLCRRWATEHRPPRMAASCWSRYPAPTSLPWSISAVSRWSVPLTFPMTRSRCWPGLTVRSLMSPAPRPSR